MLEVCHIFYTTYITVQLVNDLYLNSPDRLKALTASLQGLCHVYWLTDILGKMGSPALLLTTLLFLRLTLTPKMRSLRLHG